MCLEGQLCAERWVGGQDELAALVIRHCGDVALFQTEIQQRVIRRLASSREFAKDELAKAFDYALRHTRERRFHEGVDDEASLYFFIATLSDVLNVKAGSILSMFEMCRIEVGLNPGMEAIANEWNRDVRVEGLGVNTDDDTLNEIPIEYCHVYTKRNHCLLLVDGRDGKQSYLKKGRVGFGFECLTEEQKLSLAQYKHQTLLEYMQQLLPDYRCANYLHRDHLFQHWGLTCYPIEKINKVEMHERFSSSYQLPEKQSKFARPILALELVGALGPCVRCYLTLPARPRQGMFDKDITQNGKGDIVFSHVKLMNFSDPLRAFTWVEDYIKNNEHGGIEKTAPIIRSFLITLNEYLRTLSNDEVLLVDADRAPGQVRFQGSDNCPLKSVKHSLTSFMDGEVVSGDGCVKSMHELSAYLFEEPLSAHLISEEGKIAHQHGRMIEGENRRYESLNKETRAGQLLDARHLERDLAGFNLEPPSVIPANTDFLLFGVKKKKQIKRHPQARSNSDKENQASKKKPINDDASLR